MDRKDNKLFFKYMDEEVRREIKQLDRKYKDDEDYQEEKHFNEWYDDLIWKAGGC